MGGILIDDVEFIESGEMHHCVASYGHYVSDGESLIYSLSRGSDRSTLDIDVSGRKCRPVQNRGRFNDDVPGVFTDAGTEICRIINAM